MNLILFLYVLVAFGMLVPLRAHAGLKSIVVALLQLVVFTIFFRFIPRVTSGEVLSFSYNWVPQLGLSFTYIIDGLSLVFVLLITGVGVLVFLFAGAYMQHYASVGRFYFYLTLFSGAMVGLVLSQHFIQMFVFWELTSFLSFFLISFFHEKDTARAAAFQSLFITGFGGLSLLAGIVLIGSIAGDYHFDTWVAQASVIKQHALYRPALGLILLGVFTKSAQFPFHFWLPGAMQAPTPVSAYLHSATMVKAGVFLLARLTPVLAGTNEWQYIIPLIGVVTMLTGAYFSLTQTDLKAILAYTTISALGILVLLLGIDTKLSVKAAIVFLLVHAFYKATLFMVAGTIDKKTGTRNVDEIRGLWRKMPVTAFSAAIALLSMAGLPPMLGFLGKELIYEAKVQSPGIASLILVLGVSANVMMIAVSLKILVGVFFRGSLKSPKMPDERGVMFVFGPAVLAILSLVLGLFPQLLNELVEASLQVVRAEDVGVKLKLWHGFSNVLLLSVFTVLMGVLLYAIIKWVPNLQVNWVKFNSKVFVFRFTDVFSRGIERFVMLSKRNGQIMQHGYHRYYLMTVIVLTIGLVGFQLFVARGWHLDTQFSLRPFYISGLVVVLIGATIFSLASTNRIATIVAMGVAGYVISLIYLYYSAVDLAITQLLVETVTVVMFVLILQKLPRFARLSSLKAKVRDLVIALSFGAIMTLVALKAIHVEFNRPISNYFMDNSLLKAYGSNVVNVILVDFRALDTFGEITVLAVAALGVYVLLKKTNKVV